MTLCVVGAGAMGRWVAETVDAPVAFADVDPTAASDAAADYEATTGLDAEAVALVDGAPPADRTFEAVCLAVPMPDVADAVATWAPHAECAMFDVTGAMAAPVAAMRDHLSDRERASLHPLFAPARAPGNVALVADDVGPVLSPYLADLREAGNDVFETTPDEHDAAMETVQAGTHAAVLAWALAANEVRPEFHTPVSAGLADLASTVTDGSPAVYGHIQSTFDGADDVADAARRIAEADADGFDDLYAEAGEAYRRLGDQAGLNGQAGPDGRDGPGGRSKPGESSEPSKPSKPSEPDETSKLCEPDESDNGEGER